MKHLDAGGIAIVGSENLSDKILYAAKDIVLKTTSKCPEIRDVLSIYDCFLIAPGDSGESVAAALGLDESDPQYKYGCTLPLQPPKCRTELASVVEWEHPLGSGNYNPDMGVFVHELGHAISFVLPALDLSFHGLLNQAYERSKKLNRFVNPQSTKNQWEYWAEGVRIWYYETRVSWRFETRNAFKNYDPDLTELLSIWLSEEEIPHGY